MRPLARPVRRRVRCVVPHGVNPELVITLYPGGLIGLREHRRRRELHIAAGALYARLLAAEARARQEKKT
jgi:hypothetical protein